MSANSWVTLATNDSYSLGALVLGRSLRRTGTVHQLTVMVTPGVTSSMRSLLSSVYNVIQEVNILDSKDAKNLALMSRPELGVTFTKLHCWRLTQFAKCVFLDADVLVLQNCDELFDREELSAAPDVGWPDCFNSGVFVYRPSVETHDAIINFALTKGSFDGGDQGLLNQFFSDWATKDISRHLPFIYNMCSSATYTYMPAFKQYGKDVKIVHFIGASKPWLQYLDSETRQVRPSPGSEHLQDLLQLWWDIFCNDVHSGLSSDMAGLAGAFSKLTLGAPRSAEQVALEEHLRKQAWEHGNIDYLGRDSFDNIWRKISETLAEAPQAPEAPEALEPPQAPQVPQATQAEPPPEQSKPSDEHSSALAHTPPQEAPSSASDTQLSTVSSLSETQSTESLQKETSGADSSASVEPSLKSCPLTDSGVTSEVASAGSEPSSTSAPAPASVSVPTSAHAAPTSAPSAPVTESVAPIPSAKTVASVPASPVEPPVPVEPSAPVPAEPSASAAAASTPAPITPIPVQVPTAEPVPPVAPAQFPVPDASTEATAEAQLPQEPVFVPPADTAPPQPIPTPTSPTAVAEIIPESQSKASLTQPLQSEAVVKSVPEAPMDDDISQTASQSEVSQVAAPQATESSPSLAQARPPPTAAETSQSVEAVVGALVSQSVAAVGLPASWSVETAQEVPQSTGARIEDLVLESVEVAMGKPGSQSVVAADPETSSDSSTIYHSVETSSTTSSQSETPQVQAQPVTTSGLSSEPPDTRSELSEVPFSYDSVESVLTSTLTTTSPEPPVHPVPIPSGELVESQVESSGKKGFQIDSSKFPDFTVPVSDLLPQIQASSRTESVVTTQVALTPESNIGSQGVVVTEPTPPVSPEGNIVPLTAQSTPETLSVVSDIPETPPVGTSVATATASPSQTTVPSEQSVALEGLAQDPKAPIPPKRRHKPSQSADQAAGGKPSKPSKSQRGKK